MINDKSVRVDENNGSQLTIWPVSTVGLIATALAVVVLHLDKWFDQDATYLHFAWIISRVVLLAAGLLSAAWAVAACPRSVPVLGSAALTAAIASWAVEAEWDTLRLLLSLAAAVAAVGAFLMLLPRAVCRLVVSVLIVIHFVGILTAVTSVPPPGAPAPWLTTQLWTRFYRPYLQFVYLNNAYHFYAPEPGAATLLWFHIEYADGSSRWLKVPDRKRDFKDPLLLEYYRRLPIAQNINQVASLPLVPPDVARRRAMAGAWFGLPSPDEIALYLPGVPQYRPPAGNSRSLLESYAKFVANCQPPPAGSGRIRGIKVYRVVHAIVQPWRFAQGMDPCDRTLYLPYFEGEFDSDGRLINPEDPALYWLIPILDVDKKEQANAADATPSRAQGAAARHLLDYLHVHAGSSPWEEEE
jgi:hypothetical protein